jgi:hypothetical protein
MAQAHSAHVQGQAMARELQHLATTISNTSMSEAVVAGLAGALAILGLVGIYPLYLMAITTIVLGFGFLAQGAGLGSRYKQLKKIAGSQKRKTALSSGISLEILAGVAGIVLGALVLVGVAPLALGAVAAIVFGAVLPFSGGTNSAIDRLFSELEEPSKHSKLGLHSKVAAVSGLDTLAGIAAIVLGVLALMNIGWPLVLTLAADLTLAVALALTGTTMGAQFGKTAEHYKSEAES